MDHKDRSSQCIYCDRVAFKDETNQKKCIFHMEKKHWYTENGSKKVWNYEKVDLFWEHIRKDVMLNDKNYDFSYFVFPIAQLTQANRYYIADIELQDDRNFTTKMAFNFWNENRAMIFDKETSFSHAVFLDDITFSFMMYAGSEHTTMFVSSADFSYARFDEWVDFRGIEFRGVVGFMDTVFHSCSFDSATFHDHVMFSGTKFLDEVSFSMINLFNNNLNFYGCTITNGIFQHFNANSHLFPTQQGEKLPIGKIVFSDTIFLGKNEINFKFSDHQIEQVQALTFKSCTFSTASTMVIKGINLKEFVINDVDNFASLVSLYNLEITEKLTLRNTIFRNTEFLHFVADNKNIDIQLENISWVDSKFNDIRIGEPNKKTSLNLRNTYRQLKSAHDKQGDYIAANHFYTKEMGSYQDDLSKRSNIGQLQDKIIFGWNRVISNFSQSWLLAMGWLFLQGIIFYLLSYNHLNVVVLLLMFTIGVVLDNLYRRKEMRSYFNFWIPFIYLLGSFLSIYNVNISELITFVLPMNFSWNTDLGYSQSIWIFNKLIAGAIIYQLVIALKRKTKR